MKDWEHLNISILNAFDDIVKKEEELSGYSHLWKVVYKYKNYIIHFSSEYGFLSFYILDKNGINLRIMNKNKEIFYDSFKTNKENISTVIEFLIKHRDEIFKE